MPNAPMMYASLSPVRRVLYQEYVSRHGCEPRTLTDLDEVADALYPVGVYLAAHHDLDREETPHA